ncbi:facilitated trehalose transporter Tret1-like [Episyrphus balteatus]|uniref:facilitated trehalose transporter Tret1-like n=1 Tax=Episyrphus balteatus TaxID=286459 RepID=UPI0024850A19|nr:facilitated trehalose transporter Tret1-like [Episyrphus balteatus]
MEPYKKHRVILTALNANLVNVAFGTCLGWSSPIVPKLNTHTEDSPLKFPITKEEEGWITSIITLGSLSTCIIGGPLGGLIGRKWTLLVGSMFFTASFILMMVATEVWFIYLGRLMQGFGAGLCVATLPLYVGEIATDDVRGALGSLMALNLLGGILYVYCIGPYVSYIALQWFCIAIPILFLVIFPFMPESPYFYAARNQRPEGIKSLQFLRGQKASQVEAEMTKVQKNVDEAKSRKGKLTDVICNRGYRKALFICCGLLTLQQLTGTSVVTFNSQSIFSSAKSTLDPAIATIILGVVQLFSNLITPFVVDRSGRKIVLLISACGMCVSLVALGTFFYIQAFGDATGIEWLPVPALIAFNVLYSFGFGPLPWAVLGEIFPLNIKPIGTSIACVCAFITGFVVTRWFPELNALGPYYAFWIFGSLCIVALLFVIFVMFETKGLSLQQIEEKLHAK